MEIKVLDLTINEQDNIIGSPTMGMYFSCLVLSVDGDVHCESTMISPPQKASCDFPDMIVGKYLVDQMIMQFQGDQREEVRRVLYGN